MACSLCEYAKPIEDQGHLYLTVAESQRNIEPLRQLLERNGFPAEVQDGRILATKYISKATVLAIIGLLTEAIPAEERERLSIRVAGDPSRSATPLLVPFDLFVKRMEHYDLVRIIQQNEFTSYMQPIYTRAGMLFGYEFLLRPVPGGTPFKPFELFEVAQKTGLHSFLDRSARISAIKTSSGVVHTGLKRFVNFLPSSIYDPNYCLSHTFAAIEQYRLDPNDFVFEVVETEHITDIKHLQNIFEVYKKNGVQVALDDVGSGFSTLEALDRLQPDFVKIDRGLVDKVDHNPENQAQIGQIIEMARSFGGTVLAEGIEREEEAAYCREAGIDLLQGYLFGKPSPEPVMK